MWETWVGSLGWEDSLEKGKATHFSILAWRIPWTVQSVGCKESDMTEGLSLSLPYKELDSFKLGILQGVEKKKKTDYIVLVKIPHVSKSIFSWRYPGWFDKEWCTKYRCTVLTAINYRQ